MMSSPETPLASKMQWCCKTALEWPALAVAVAEEVNKERVKDVLDRKNKIRVRKDRNRRRAETPDEKQARFEKRRKASKKGAAKPVKVDRGDQ